MTEKKDKTKSNLFSSQNKLDIETAQVVEIQ